MTRALESLDYEPPIEYPPIDFEPAKPQLSLIHSMVEIVEPVQEVAYEPLTPEQAFKAGAYDGVTGLVRNVAAESLGYYRHPTNIYSATIRW